MKYQSQPSRRRKFMQTLGGAALAASLAGKLPAASLKPLRGVFPIGHTPVTQAGKLDLDCLRNEVKFRNKYKVHGFASPQIASGWAALSERERLDGAEAILAAG